MTPATGLAIEYLPIGQLTPYARNSRTHSPEQLQALAHAIRTYGFNNPVAIDGTGGIIAGHGRVQAASLAGLDTVPCIRLTHLSDAQRRAYVIADNRMAEMGGWDKAMLASEIEDLLMDAENAIELDDLGFDEDAATALSAFLPDFEPATAAAPVVARTPHSEPSADDYADVGEGATNPGEGKGLRYPLILQLDKPTFARWRKAKGKGSDSDAITALLELRRLVTEYLPVDPTNIDAVAAAFADMAEVAAGATGAAGAMGETTA